MGSLLPTNPNNFLLKTNKHAASIWPSVIARGFDPRKVDLCSLKNLYTNVSSSFICNAQQLEKSRCPSTFEQFNTLQDICAMEYYSAIGRNRLLIQGATWVNFQRIMLNEKTDPKDCMLYEFNRNIFSISRF